MVLVSVLVAVGQGNDGEGVDRLHQRTLCKGFCYHLTAIVWHCIPDGKKVTQIKGSVNSHHLNTRNLKPATKPLIQSLCHPVVKADLLTLNFFPHQLNNPDIETTATPQTPGPRYVRVAEEANDQK